MVSMYVRLLPELTSMSVLIKEVSFPDTARNFLQSCSDLPYDFQI